MVSSLFANPIKGKRFLCGYFKNLALQEVIYLLLTKYLIMPYVESIETTTFNPSLSVVLAFCKFGSLLPSPTKQRKL